MDEVTVQLKMIRFHVRVAEHLFRLVESLCLDAAAHLYLVGLRPLLDKDIYFK